MMSVLSHTVHMILNMTSQKRRGYRGTEERTRHMTYM
jgi:hypothetical protein